MSTLFLHVLGLSLIICVTISSSKSSKSLAKYRRERRDWSLQGLFQNLLDSIDNDISTTSNVTNITTPAQTPSNSTTSQTTPQTTSPFTLSSSTTTKRRRNSTTTSSSSSTPFSTTPLTTTTEDPRCRSDQALDTVCSVPEALVGENFWDVYYIMFSDDVIRALLFSCTSGHWCLYDKLDFWDALMMERAEMVRNSDLFNAVCEIDSLTCLHSFLSNYTECETYKRMQLTLQSINLLCQLKHEVTTTPECIEHVLAALHVTVVDILRDQNQKEYDDTFENNCKSPETQITRTFLCLEHKCPQSTSVLTSFEPWKWFIPDISTISDTISKCGYRSDVCDDDTKFRNSTGTKSSSISSSSMSSASTGAWTDPGHLIGVEPFNPEENGAALENTQEEEEDAWEYAYDANMLLGMAMTSLILLSVMVIGFCLWWRKLHRDRVVKAGYTQLRCDEA
ncbi:uncharacterized protein LOC110449729 [Mizuhopecten yessoensis]|uniref:Uncharacterized protein n=1 Tax=Mizuhopecten yessoensis TaxID=6573 RepID=A0A210QQM8_MIZYE|nr:uncharacterized protein LOC110449729 [Mizuhopecten yessoensis]OWF51043.1 hypothetical protein KP79_PYT19575 [Mizuhopecten yessoensis]